MARRSSGARSRGWWWAAAGSVAVHALLLLALAGSRGAADARALAAAGEAAWIDLIPFAAAEEVATVSAPPIEDQPPPTRLTDAPEGDRDHAPLRSIAPRVAEGAARWSPAPDEGDQQGRSSTERAWRRDRSTLRSRLTDGAAVWQPARSLVSDRWSSPQAERREPITGVGDEVRTERPTRLAAAPPVVEPEPSPDGKAALGHDEPPRAPAPPARAEPAPLAARVSDRRGVGPLAAAAGPRGFDSPQRGPAADDESERAASDQARPGITDFSRASVHAAVDSPRGHGPAAVPGAVSQPAAGAAPSQPGAQIPASVAAALDERTQDRRYQRYIDEIQRRVNSIRDFPHELALRLEQGETVVRFVLRTDGQISDGVRVVKSSGFDQFDRAAARAVQRAAPFPPMPDFAGARPLPVSVRVAFENPLVR
jgi:TonB family protein